VRAAIEGHDVVPEPGELAPRPPVLCPGCPHRGVFMVLRKLKAYVTGDIGCYTLGTLPPLEGLHTCLCMGAGVGQAHGIDAICGADANTVAVIGDSTFVHSGITPLVNIAYNGGACTVIIMDNGTTAMTGGQDHPATGHTLSGRPGHQLDLPAICRAAGIEDVQVIDPRNLEATESALRSAMSSDRPSVVIAQCPCIFVSRERGAPRQIDEELCSRCGLCVRTGCPAISTRATDDPKRPQPVIDAALCFGCSLCAQVCPKEAIQLAEAACPEEA
jgi:indolepyruvate ferredoxin oxidoreductase alpha subunit